jgi:S-adenosylmethionine-diacylgycerolhomoserine-N-methlytransferase
MIPDWFIALDNAWNMLGRQGTLGVTDFYVSRKYPAENLRRHRWLARSFWPIWFHNDNVFLSAGHVQYLNWKFQPIHFSEHRAPVPYLPLVRVPYYCFIGRPR